MAARPEDYTVPPAGAKRVAERGQRPCIGSAPESLHALFAVAGEGEELDDVSHLPPFANDENRALDRAVRVRMHASKQHHS